jgi:TolB-like protein
MKGWTEQQTVFLEKVYIEGQASDDTRIAGLFVNQQPILRREGQSIFFSHLADLKEGENTILIEARDDASNIATFKIIIIRRIPKALQMRERMSLTVVPFEQKGIVAEASLSLHDNLINSLVNQHRFQVVDREQLDKILLEQKISRTQLVDRDTALMLGKLVAARSVITGSIIESRKGIEIVARMIDTETSMIIEMEDVYDEAKDLLALKKLSEGLAIKFHKDFPLLDGNVVQLKGNTIFTDLGAGKVKLNRRLIIYREELIKHPITGKVLGTDNIIIGRARVTQILPDLSKAEISSNRKMLVRPMDKVITE